MSQQEVVTEPCHSWELEKLRLDNLITDFIKAHDPMGKVGIPFWVIVHLRNVQL